MGGQAPSHRRIPEESLPAAVECRLVARLRARAQAGEIGGDVQREALDWRTRGERFHARGVGRRTDGNQDERNDGTHGMSLRRSPGLPQRGASAVCCAGFM
jgi:hypothetical protein